MNTLLSFLSGPSGKTSAMRVMSCAVVFMVMGTWSAISIKKGELQPLDETLMGVVIAVMVGQNIHKKFELTKDKSAE